MYRWHLHDDPTPEQFAALTEYAEYLNKLSFTFYISDTRISHGDFSIKATENGILVDNIRDELDENERYIAVLLLYAKEVMGDNNVKVTTSDWNTLWLTDDPRDIRRSFDVRLQYKWCLLRNPTDAEFYDLRKVAKLMEVFTMTKDFIMATNFSIVPHKTDLNLNQTRIIKKLDPETEEKILMLLTHAEDVGFCKLEINRGDLLYKQLKNLPISNKAKLSVFSQLKVL